MSKLYFKYGTMNSSKSANLLMVKHNYEEQGMSVLLIKPRVDNRENTDIVKSRVGIESPCLMVSKDENLMELDWINYDVIMVDEAQFLTTEQIDDLYQMSFKKPVLCYGLLTDFSQKLFPGSKRLVELAESFEKIKTICKCGNAANYNARLDEDGNMILIGDQVQIGGNESYKAVCKECYKLLQYKHQ